MKIRNWILPAVFFTLSLAAYVWYINNSYKASFIEIKVGLENEVDANQLTCYYNIGDGYTESQKVYFNLNEKNVLGTKIKLNQGETLEKIRFDFAKNKVYSFSYLELSFNKKKWKYNPEQFSNLVINTSIGVNHYSFKKNFFKLKTGSEDPNMTLKIRGPNNEIIFFWFLAIIFFSVPLLKTIKSFKIKMLSEINVFLALIFIITIPLKNSLTTFAAICLIVFAVFRIIKDKPKLLISKILFLTILFLVPLPYVFFDNYAINVGIYICAGLLVLTLPQISFTTKQLETIKNAFIVFCTLYSFLYINIALYVLGVEGMSVKQFISEPKEAALFIKPFFSYYHPTFLSYFVSVGLLFKLDFKAENITSKVIIIIFLLISTSRFAIYLILLWLMLLSFKRMKLSSIWYMLGGVISFACLMLSSYYFDIYRKEQWVYYLKNPIRFLGNGLNTNSVIEYSNSFTHSHNQFIWFLSIYGIISFFALLGYVSFLIIKYSKEKDILKLFVSFSFVGLCTIETPFNTNKASLMISFLLAFFLIVDSKIRNKLSE